MTRPPDFVTVAEIVATGLGTKTAVHRWLNETDPAKPHLPSYRVGRSIRIHRADWHRFLRAHEYRGRRR